MLRRVRQVVAWVLGIAVLLVPPTATLLPIGAAPSLAQGAAGPKREGVLKQIALPHPYYYREMYVPQVTSGPSAVTWSPDGKELIYSMQGSLWRQRLGSPVARQLTSGPGYDYQPDWSPDGRSVAFASYADDAIELKLLDLTTGRITAFTRNGGVNLEPRWSHDGRRLAFVSTMYEGRWHVFVGAVSDRQLATPERLTEDTNSKLPRYYYSTWDHYLSPTWSPDGTELILVSNRGRIHGTGGFWRMETRAGAPMRELHYEETTWKARPNWSPDGKRLVYSSYLGRQWHQLWLMPSDGGDVIPLTYGEFDATAPRWSPDAARIAYISNEGGNTSLWIIDVLGGKRRRVEIGERRYRGPVGTLNIVVVEQDGGRPIPARVSVTGPDGRSYAPDDAWRHADEAFVRAERRYEYGYFHTPGRSELTVPAGRLTVEVMRGPEYRIARHEIAVRPGEARTHRVTLGRIARMPPRGWWSGDLHVHMNYGGAYRNTPRHLAFQARAEDLHVVENLIVNKEQRIPDIDYFSGAPDPVSTEDFLLMHGQEFHTSFWGHTGLLGLRDHYLLPDYAGYPNTAVASLQPMNATVADLARSQGAIMGYVHPFDTRPDPENQAEPLRYELPVDVALGKVDYLEVMGYSDHLSTSEIWYRLLNCGFRIPAGAGTDAFPNFASLRGPAGLVRVYVKTGPTLDHARWLAGIKAGQTFVTNAPLLEFTLGGKEIGAEVRLPRGRHELPARVRMRSIVPIDHLEIIGNGDVVASVPLSGSRMAADTTVTLPVTGSGWYVLRARSNRPTLPILDLYPFASTSPIYVQMGDEPVRSREDAQFFVKWIDRIEAAAREHAEWNTAAEKAASLKLISQARDVFRERVAEANARRASRAEGAENRD